MSSDRAAGPRRTVTLPAVPDDPERDAPARRSDRRKVGRPARVDREMIAKAAHEVGLDRVTMKAVADRLGVSVPGLYHHVEGREDLMRLAAEYSASQIEVPVDRGQHWTEWLLEWAQYMHRAFVAEPQLMNQFLHRSIGVERMVVHVDAMLALLLRHGFDPHDAMDAYVHVSQCAIGAALTDLREAEGAREGRPDIVEYHRALAMSPPDELPSLRRLASTPRVTPRPTFEERICTLLVGIAARRGEPWDAIPALAERSRADAGAADARVPLAGIGALHP
jgi:AcrR family transcriptional regulator